MDEHPPRLVYDDDCGFCGWCADYAAARGTFELVGFSELTPDQLARLPSDYEECVHLLTDREVYSCGAAVEEIGRRLEGTERYGALAFRALPGSERLREPLYRFVAARRAVLGRVRRR